VRALLAVPLVREEWIIGGLVVRRREPGEFSPALVDRLGAFAGPSALTIQNARLFREIQEKGQQLEVASETGGGSTFTMRLPAVVVDLRAEAPPVATPEAAPADACTVLVIDDENEINRDMLSRRLMKRGYEVVMALDGQQGVDLAHAEAPAPILIDMSLPVLYGWEATRQLKSAPATRGIPIIALTAHAMSGDRDKALEACADDFDTKAMDPALLPEKMETLLSRAAGS
jgi:two-component system, cell cycle response regulator DivK